ncbi:MAG: MmgE/PrpD family protein [Deltaproteobacteria bacterium]|nr:MAG: MmgE/PrpD family protein [Deltaproteobacteria bacterium]
MPALVFSCEWRVVAETFAGARHEVHVAYPKGHPENPFLDAEVEEKFLRLAEPSLGKTRCRKFIDWAWRLAAGKGRKYRRAFSAAGNFLIDSNGRTMRRL